MQIDFSKKIQVILDSSGLSKKEFADKFGISPSALSHYLTGRRKPEFDVILKLLESGVSPFYLFYNLGEPFDYRFDKCKSLFKENEENEEIIPIYLEDFLIKNLKRTHRLQRNLINIFFPIPEFITRYLKELDEKNIKDLKIENAKEKMITFIKTLKLNKIFDSETKRKKVIKEIYENYSDIEVYLLLKYPQKFI